MLTKALFHKQMAEIKSMYFRSKKTGQIRTGTGMKVLFIVLYAFMLIAFYALAAAMGSAFLVLGLDWMYFMIMTILAFLTGVIGSIFTTMSALFKAKDNEMLLSMPIPPSKILLCRMISVWVMSFIYEAMVMIPSIAYYCVNGRPSILSIIFSILGLFLMAFMVTGFSCLFGWIAALISSKLKNQKILTVIISVILIAVVMYFRFRANAIFRGIAENAATIGASVKGWGYPIYALGLGMSGNAIGFIVFLGMTAVVFGLTWLIMSKSFVKIVATKNEAVNSNSKKAKIKTAKVKSALRRKEMKRFVSSPTYMLNCGIGLLFLLAGAVLLIVKSNNLSLIFTMLESTNPLLVKGITVFGAAAVWVLTSFCDIAAPSISLEGDKIWQLQVLPINLYDVLMAKLYVHVIIVSVPALICTVVMGLVLHLNAFSFILLVLSSLAYVVFSGSVMLAIDLKKPMLEWNSETQPIKQNANILITMFGSMILAAILGVLYFLLGRVISGSIYLLICFVGFAGGTLLINKWFKTKGRRIFESL